MPGGAEVAAGVPVVGPVGEPVVEPVVGPLVEPGGSFFPPAPQAAISALAAAVPNPRSASLRMASRLGKSPSTWSMAISSAM
jgi:hypothetical protein